METRAVIFDMDGVLLDSGAHHRQAWRALLDELGVTPSQPEFWRLTIGRPSVEAVPLLLDRATPCPRPAGSPSASSITTGGSPARARRRFAVSSRSSTTSPRAACPARWPPRPRAPTPSRCWSESACGTVSTWSSRPRTSAGANPTRKFYLRAARVLGHEPARCLVFEDALVGVRAARSAGMRVIGVSTAHTQTELCAAGAERAIEHFEGFTWPA